jgi:hypothetical protein
MLYFTFLLFGLISTAPIYLPLSNTPLSGSVGYPGNTEVTYIFNPQNDKFELNFWRTTVFNRNYAPNLSFLVQDQYGDIIDNYFIGKSSYFSSSGNYSLTVFNYYTGVNFQVRVCLFSCDYSCPYDMTYGYCKGEGACVNGICQCDNSSTVQVDHYDCSLKPPLPETSSSSYMVVMLTLIFVGVILVIFIPLAIFSLCRTLARRAAVERQPIIQHYQGVSPVQAYNTVPYIVTAQPYNPNSLPYQTYTPVVQAYNPSFQPTVDPKAQESGTPNKV